MRTLFALLCISAGAPALAQAGAQEPPPDQSRVTSTSPAVRVTLGGHLELRYAALDGAVEEARAALNGPAGLPDGTVTTLNASAAVRLDAEFDRMRVVVELERLPYSDGSTLGLGDDAIAPVIDQAYVEVRGFLSDKLTLRIGQFDFDYRLRPHGEAFFFDADAESFWNGSNGTRVRATADRDQTAAAGVRFQYEPFDILLVEFALVWRNETGGPGRPSDDELAAILYANAITGERTALFVLAALCAGPGHAAEVWTVGLGGNQYFGPQRQIEMFGEAYFQFGRIGPDVRKSAWGGQIGARLALPSGLWGELALSYRSGDRRPTDSRDQSFQSAERIDRFLLVESAEFGFDWDTNVRSVQLYAGYGFSPSVSVRGGLGWFAFNEDLVAAIGTVPNSDDRIGIEADGAVSCAVNAQVTCTLRGGVLFSSDVLEALTVDDSRTAWVVVAGMGLRF